MRPDTLHIVTRDSPMRTAPLSIAVVASNAHVARHSGNAAGDVERRSLASKLNSDVTGNR